MKRAWSGFQVDSKIVVSGPEMEFNPPCEHLQTLFWNFLEIIWYRKRRVQRCRVDCCNYTFSVQTWEQHTKEYIITDKLNRAEYADQLFEANANLAILTLILAALNFSWSYRAPFLILGTFTCVFGARQIFTFLHVCLLVLNDVSYFS